MYASRSDLVNRFGEHEISLLEDTDNNGANPAVSTEALQDAEEEANSYIAIRYTLPLPRVPAPLRIAVCDIARFRMYKDRTTDEVKYRYERAIKWLVELSFGRVKLVFTPALNDKEADADRSSSAVAGHYDGVDFSSEVMDKMPSLGEPSIWHR